MKEPTIKSLESELLVLQEIIHALLVNFSNSELYQIWAQVSHPDARSLIYRTIGAKEFEKLKQEAGDD